MKFYTSDPKQEFKMLIAIGKKNHCTSSDELRLYIVNHHLESRFPNIMGLVHMSKGKIQWVYEGGFSPEYYWQICAALKLNNKGSNSSVDGFEPFGVHSSTRRTRSKTKHSYKSSSERRRRYK